MKSRLFPFGYLFAPLSMQSGLALVNVCRGTVWKCGVWESPLHLQAQLLHACMGKRWQLPMKCFSSPCSKGHGAALPCYSRCNSDRCFSFTLHHIVSWWQLRELSSGMGFPSLMSELGVHLELCPACVGWAQEDSCPHGEVHGRGDIAGETHVGTHGQSHSKGAGSQTPREWWGTFWNINNKDWVPQSSSRHCSL